MNPAQLLEHFDRISEAPDAVARLRRFILDLAVRGKLVEQDLNDEPAAELIKRIQAEKQETFEPIKGTETPFAIPPTWIWVPATFPAYLVSDLGKKVQTKDVLKSGDFPVVDQGKMFIRGYCNDQSKVIRVAAPMILFGDHTRETKLIDFDFVVGADGVKLLQPVCLETRYYYLALQWLPLDSRGYGRHFKLLRAAFLPIPPLAEQHRIVAKVDELMALCDQLEAAQNEREARRDRLVASSLHQIQNPDDLTPVFLDHLPRLTIRPEHIKQLRQTILNLAVRGRLVPQDPNDEPVAASLTGLDVDGEWPFHLPHSWGWRRIGDLSELVTDGEHATPTRIDEHEVPLVTAKNVRDGEMDYAMTDWVSFDTAGKAWRRCRPLVGDILLVCVGATTGRLCVLRELKDMVLVRSVALIRPSNIADVDYLALAMRSPLGQSQIWRSVKATAQPCLYINRINSLVFPLPPLAEQHRIVAKVDELMALCDQLETQLTTTQTVSRRLLDAVLHETFSGQHELQPAFQDEL